MYLNIILGIKYFSFVDDVSASTFTKKKFIKACIKKAHRNTTEAVQKILNSLNFCFSNIASFVEKAVLLW